MSGYHSGVMWNNGEANNWTKYRRCWTCCNKKQLAGTSSWHQGHTSAVLYRAAYRYSVGRKWRGQTMPGQSQLSRGSEEGRESAPPLSPFSARISAAHGAIKVVNIASRGATCFVSFSPPPFFSTVCLKRRSHIWNSSSLGGLLFLHLSRLSPPHKALAFHWQKAP